MTPYASRADDLNGGKYLPSQGWWAFDVNMAAQNLPGCLRGRTFLPF